MEVVFMLTIPAHFPSKVSEVLFRPQTRVFDRVHELTGLSSCS